MIRKKMEKNFKGMCHLNDSYLTVIFYNYPTSSENEISSWKFWNVNKR